MLMKYLSLVIMIFIIGTVSCQSEKSETSPKKVESKTGVEGKDATSQEVDTLNKKMDEMMQGVQ